MCSSAQLCLSPSLSHKGRTTEILKGGNVDVDVCHRLVCGIDEIGGERDL